MTRIEDAQALALEGLRETFDHVEAQPDGSLLLVRDGAWFEMTMTLRLTRLPEGQDA